MFFAAGVGAYGAAMFHLFTHAFFKALLFLGAGSVIHAMHHEQDMRYYGGLRKEIPFTFWAMMAGTLAITGVGIVRRGFGFAGFYSKDAIIESAYASGSGAGHVAFWLGVLAALLTSFYSLAADLPDLLRQAALGRVASISSTRSTAIMTIARRGAWRQRARRRTHVARRAPAAIIRTKARWTMLVPLGLLSLGAVLAGQLFHAPSSMPSARRDSGAAASPSASISPHAAHDVAAVGQAVRRRSSMLIGLCDRLVRLHPQPDAPAAASSRQFGAVYRFLSTNGISTSSTTSSSSARRSGSAGCSGSGGDEGTIDRFGPDGAASRSASAPRHRAAPVRLSLHLCAGDAARPVAAATWAIGGRDDGAALPVHPDRSSRCSAALPCLFVKRQWRALDRAGRRRWSTSRSASACGRATTRRAAVAVRRVACRSSAAFAWALGIDGIALMLIVLTAFLMPICIGASWRSIEKRVPEYMAAFLLMETLMHRRLRGAGPVPLLHLLRGRPDPDVPDHRHLGRRRADLRQLQILPLHACSARC